MSNGGNGLNPMRGHTLDVAGGGGLYVYCIVPARENVSLGAIGIEGRDVHSVVHNGLCALVHKCPAQPYQSQDAEAVSSWAMAHHQLVDAAWRRWGAVLPLTFNTVIKPEHASSADENLLVWLKAEYEPLRSKLDDLRGKAEYGVQVFWDTTRIAGEVSTASPEIRELNEQLGTMPRGLAYMYRQKLEALLKRGMEARASEEFQGVYGDISRWVDNIHVEKTKRSDEGPHMLTNLSCLVSEERYPDVAAALERIRDKEGFSVRLLGPLPPYSFC